MIGICMYACKAFFMNANIVVYTGPLVASGREYMILSTKRNKEYSSGHQIGSII